MLPADPCWAPGGGLRPNNGFRIMGMGFFGPVLGGKPCVGSRTRLQVGEKNRNNSNNSTSGTLLTSGLHHLSLQLA
jgi:hypothetical protein